MVLESGWIDIVAERFFVVSALMLGFLRNDALRKMLLFTILLKKLQLYFSTLNMEDYSAVNEDLIKCFQCI